MISTAKEIVSNPHGGTANFTVAAIILAFIIYITAKGELQTYIQLFFYATPSVPAQPSVNPTVLPNISSTPGYVIPPTTGNPGLTTKLF